MPEIPTEAVQAVRSAVERGMAEVYHSGGVERIEFVSTAFLAWLEEIRADERRKVAEEIAATIDTAGEKAKAYHYKAAMSRAARIARERGEAHDPR